jgi:uncharacterized membrane protein YhaH (DUF805 family)
MLVQSEWVDFYVSPRGRLARHPYWTRGLITFFLIGCAYAIFDRIAHLNGVFPLLVLALLWPNIAVMGRRLHDVGVSGWWSGAILLAPTFVMLVTRMYQYADYAMYTTSAAQALLGVIPGTVGPNRFGPQPESIRAL